MEATVNTPTKHRSRAQKHLDVYEPWQAEHELAMACRDVEEWLNEGVRVFEMIRYEDRVYRIGVTGGLFPTNEAAEVEEVFQERYRQWLTVARSGAATVRACRQRFAHVDHADEYEECMQFAEGVVSGRPPATLARAAGARFDELTEEEADELRDLLKAPPGSPGKLNWEPKQVPDGDASLLR
jgi:hypothetical protein